MPRVIEDEHPLLGVVGLIRPGIVGEGENPTVPYAPHGTPGQVTKVDDEIGRNIPTLLVDTLGHEAPRPHGLAMVIHHCFQTGSDLIPHSGKVGRGDKPLRLPPLDVDE
jgi:hypothetical protein